MGHSQASKQETHERVVELAARRFRELGLDGLSIANLMKEAGLTHGGFYKHFASRDDLVEQALALALNSSEGSLLGQRTAGFEHLVGEYLSPAHCGEIGAGCAVGALLNDMARSSDEARGLYTKRLQTHLSKLSGLLASRENAILAVCAMVGALGLARAVNDQVLADEILESAGHALLEKIPH